MNRLNNRGSWHLRLMLLWSILALTTINTISAQDNNEKAYVKIQVDGLACPFCAYGLEKKLKKIKGSTDIKIDIQKGYVFFRIPKENKPSEDKLRELVKDAGFTAREIKISDKPFSDGDE